MKITPLFILCLLLLLASGQTAYAQQPSKKTYETTRLETAPKIDGELNDPAWLRINEVASDFIQIETELGQPARQRSEVKIAYDDEAIYIGAMLYDTQPDSILKQLTIRDGFGNADWFAIVIDAYEDGNNGVGFIVSAAGVQIDIKYSVYGEDDTWNAVWDSEVRITDEGWVVEMKIPYSALRFPDKAEQTWNINLARSIRRSRERSWWNELDPSVKGFFNQAGKLTGIKNIVPPIRLFLNPYISGNTESNTANGEVQWSRGFNLGMDLKYGINDAYTLDMTLVPDFGQVVSDDVVLNLSPFEVRFNENRQFFTEGTELFQKADLFYSRRIGGTPQGFYEVSDLQNEGYRIIDNPRDVQLLNSTKISGRGQSGLGVGVLNAVTGAAFAVVEDSLGYQKEIQTAPLTNYNVFVLDQNLKNNSYISLINTNVFRSGSAYEANVTGTEFRLADATNTYEIIGTAALSQQYVQEGAPDLGYNAYLELGKVSGAVQYGYSGRLISDAYDINDFGFQPVNNKIENFAYVNYNRFQPFGRFLRGQAGMNVYLEHQYNTRQFSGFGVNLDFFAMTKKFFAVGGNFSVSPLGTYDLFEARNGQILEIPENGFANFWFSSDYRKPFALDASVYAFAVNQDGRFEVGGRLAPIVRISDKLSFNLSSDYSYAENFIGWVASVNAQPIVGRRNYLTISNVLTANYVFNDKMGVSLRVRHNWTEATHDKFYYIEQSGAIIENDWDRTDENGELLTIDRNFNFLSVDLVYSWQFAPGSFLTANWKNNIFADNVVPLGESYFYNLRNTTAADQTNIFSVKILYFLDYFNVQRRFENKFTK